MELIIQAVQTQLTVGGNLAEVLDNIGDMIRDRVALAGEIAASTAEGRMSAMILGGMPFILALIIQVVSPGYLSPLFTEKIGLIMLGVAGVLMVVGFLIIRSMLNLDL
jgi:tight adherence protein B